MNIGLIFLVSGCALFIGLLVLVIRPSSLKIHVAPKHYFSNENVVIQRPSFVIDMGGRPVGEVEATILADMILNFDDLINNRYKVPDKLHPKYDHIAEKKVAPSDPPDTIKESNPPDDVTKYIDVNSL